MNTVMIALALIELAAKVAPEVIDMVREIKSDKPITLADIQALQDRIKPPEAYFAEEGGV